MSDKKPARRQRHDWNQLKAEFLGGEWQEVAPFLKERIGAKRANVGWYGLKTKGWTNEKDQMKERIAAKAYAKVEEKQSNEMAQALDNIRSEIMRRAQPHASIETQVRDLNVLWNMIRVENGMPTTIAKNENRNHDESLLEKEGLSSLLIKAKDANASGQSNVTNQA